MAAIYAVILCLLFNTIASQRSPYAPRPIIYPEPLPQYTSPPSVEDRFGGTQSTTPYIQQQTDSGSLLPIDEINRIYSEWPRDKIPFSVLNREHLLAHRGGASQTSGATQTRFSGSGGSDIRVQTPLQSPTSSFLGQPQNQRPERIFNDITEARILGDATQTRISIPDRPVNRARLPQSPTSSFLGQPQNFGLQSETEGTQTRFGGSLSNNGDSTRTKFGNGEPHYIIFR